MLDKLLRSATAARSQQVWDEPSLLMMDSIWRATQYLSGSTSNRIPYEIVYALKHALADWGLTDCIITTSLVKSSDFLCERISQTPKKISELLDTSFDHDLVQIAFPEIFQHSPIFCTPLYHEIGHYVEERRLSIKAIATQRADDLMEILPDRGYFSHSLETPKRRKIIFNHLIEHFCDLFSASYVGECASFYIQELSFYQEATESHPSTASRVRTIENFVNDVSDPFVDLLKEATKGETGEFLLKRRFQMPDIEDSFSDVRPFKISSEAEMHGIFPAALGLLKKSILSDGNTSIRAVPDADRWSTVVNDLTEKSIRNFMIEQAWHGHMDKT